MAVDKSDRRDQLQLGMGGEVGEMNDVPIMCSEARDGVDAHKGLEKIYAK